jgi:steroid C-25 hydroxylase gamma subunit
MIRRTIAMGVAPPALSPGGYVSRAYADRVHPETASVELQADHRGGAWDIALAWKGGEPTTGIDGDPTRFVDAAALLVPTTEAAQALTMGAPTDPVEGALWRADRPRPVHISAKGWGTVERSDAPATWQVHAEWKGGLWHLRYTLEGWNALDRFRRLAVAVWRGTGRERAGLKSISPGWIAL